MVSRGLLPASTSKDLHAPDRPIADAGPRSASRQRRRSGRRHHDHRGSRAGRVVERDGVVRRIGRHARDIAVDVLDQTDAGRGIIRRRLGERMGDDDASAVDTEMQLLPAPLPAPAVFGGGPFALAEDGQARAVDDEMQWLLHGNAIECKIEAPAPPRERGVVWSGAARSACIRPKIDRKKPSVWRNGKRKTSRSVSAVSIARSEYFLGPPGRPDGAGLHASIASSESQSVTSPRWTSASSYAGQFPTRYLVLYFGCTLEFTRELCDSCGGRHKPRQDVHQRPYFPRSEAVPGGRMR